MNILINGKILFRRITGVERYAREVINAIDKKAEKDKYWIAIPGYYKDENAVTFKNLKIIYINSPKISMIWDQVTLPLFSVRNKCVIVNFDFTTSFLRPGISTIHDMSFKANPHFFLINIKQKLVKTKLNMYCYRIVHSKYPIFTVSHFQKSEIEKYYGITDMNRIVVANNSWQHFKDVSYDDSVFEEFKIPKKQYYFSLSSNTINKNFKWIYEAAVNNPKSYFVIVGGQTSISKDVLKSLGNIFYLGYQSDERVKSLYRECKAFIFPSFYEGFGIPPMEAMSVGAKAIVSNTSCLPEIYGESVYYINPNDSAINLDELISECDVKPNYMVLNRYSWEKTAEVWIENFEKYGDKT